MRFYVFSELGGAGGGRGGCYPARSFRTSRPFANMLMRQDSVKGGGERGGVDPVGGSSPRRSLHSTGKEHHDGGAADFTMAGPMANGPGPQRWENSMVRVNFVDLGRGGGDTSSTL